MNKVLDGILAKVKELDKHVFAKPSYYGEQEEIHISETVAANVNEAIDHESGNFYQNLTVKRRHPSISNKNGASIRHSVPASPSGELIKEGAVSP